METIKLYLDSVFAAAPVTAEVQRVKAELLSNMEEKYHELKADGVSENEAIGAVISDFGNVEELFVEMGIAPQASPVESQVQAGAAGAASATAGEQVVHPTLTNIEVENFIDTYKRSARGIGLGVLLIVIGVVVLIGAGASVYFMGVNLSTGDDTWSNEVLGSLGFAFLILMVIPAVGLFIKHGMSLSNFKAIDEGHFRLDAGTRARLKMTSDDMRGRMPFKISASIGLILLGFIFIVLSPVIGTALNGAWSSSQVGSIAVMFFLLAGALAARNFIILGMDSTAYDKLLQRGDYSPENRKSAKLIEAIAALYWPLAVIIYLGWSFTTGNWHITWVVWPIAGILFGGLAAFIPELKKSKDS